MQGCGLEVTVVHKETRKGHAGRSRIHVERRGMEGFDLPDSVVQFKGCEEMVIQSI